MPTANAFPEPLENLRPIRVLDHAIDRGRLAHALLLHGADPAALEDVASHLARRLLELPPTATVHPDWFHLRPANKIRSIGVDATRELCRQLSHTANQGGRKVAVVHDADRLKRESANAFLKTLEEPPPDTTILLLTTRPHGLLSTVRSRCLNVRLPPARRDTPHAEWPQWLEDYRTWIDGLRNMKPDAERICQLTLTAYGLIRRLQGILENITSQARDARKSDPHAEGLEDDEQAAWEAGISKGARAQLLGDIEQASRDAIAPSLHSTPPGHAQPATRQLARVLAELEKTSGLLEVNLNEAAALEAFFLASMRIWTGR